MCIHRNKDFRARKCCLALFPAIRICSFFFSHSHLKVKERLWSQIESEMCLQRAKTIAQICQTRQVFGQCIMTKWVYNLDCYINYCLMLIVKLSFAILRKDLSLWSVMKILKNVTIGESVNH